MERYIRQHHEDYLTFYADEVWKELTYQKGNALAMEQTLADISDIVIIIVESPGTFAEVGAFSLSEPLRKKLLPILDVRFEREPSFLNTGPIKWIDEESLFAPAIWVPHESILRCGELLSDRLSRIPNSKGTKIADLATSPKHLVFLLCDLVGIFGPSSTEHIYILANDFVQITLDEVATLLALAEAMKILQSRVCLGKRYYVPGNGEIRAHMQKKFLDIAQLRAEVVGVLEKIPASREILRLVRQS